jgi:DDE domain
MRWVFRFVPEYEKRWNGRAKPVGSSWRVDETFIHTRPKMGYLYRAVDKDGKTVDSLCGMWRSYDVRQHEYASTTPCSVNAPVPLKGAMRSCNLVHWHLLISIAMAGKMEPSAKVFPQRFPRKGFPAKVSPQRFPRSAHLEQQPQCPID